MHQQSLRHVSLCFRLTLADCGLSTMPFLLSTLFVMGIGRSMQMQRPNTPPRKRPAEFTTGEWQLCPTALTCGDTMPCTSRKQAPLWRRLKGMLQPPFLRLSVFYSSCYTYFCCALVQACYACCATAFLARYEWSYAPALCVVIQEVLEAGQPPNMKQKMQLGRLEWHRPCE